MSVCSECDFGGGVMYGPCGGGKGFLMCGYDDRVEGSFCIGVVVECVCGGWMMQDAGFDGERGGVGKRKMERRGCRECVSERD